MWNIKSIYTAGNRSMLMMAMMLSGLSVLGYIQLCLKVEVQHLKQDVFKQEDTYYSPPTTSITTVTTRSHAIVPSSSYEYNNAGNGISTENAPNSVPIHEFASDAGDHDNAQHDTSAPKLNLKNDKPNVTTAAINGDILQDKSTPTTTLTSSSNTNFIDFAIGGFPKSGTTFLSHQFLNIPQIYFGSDQAKEVHEIRKGQMAKLRNKYKTFVVPTNTTTSATGRIRTPQGESILTAFKAPEILQSVLALRTLRDSFSNIDLIITIRHPVWWFQSFYNFRLRENRIDGEEFSSTKKRNRIQLKPAQDLVGRCDHDCTLRHGNLAAKCLNRKHGAKYVCTDSSNFHRALARLALTPMDTPEEKKLLGTSHYDFTWSHYSGRVYLMEIGQLRDTNKTRTFQFERDMEEFLHLKNGSLSMKRARELRPKDHGKIWKERNKLIRLSQYGVHSDNVGKDSSEREEGRHERQLQRPTIPMHPTDGTMMIRNNTITRRESIMRKGRKRNKRGIQSRSKQINICDDKYRQLRQVLVANGSKAATWIENYLIKSDRLVISSREYFAELLRSWYEDPCIRV